MNIIISNPSGIYYGVYDATPLVAATWTQAGALNPPTAIAVLDELPAGAGTFSGTIYEAAESFTPDNTSSVIITFRPTTIGIHTATLTSDSDATAEASAALSGDCTNQFDTAYQDKAAYKNYIFQQYR